MKSFLPAALLALLPLCSVAADPSLATDDAEIRRMLQIRVDAQKQATGAVVGIIGPDGRRVIAYGSFGLHDRRAMDGDSVFDVGSITKVFTALLLADAVRRGEMALDDPAAKYLPARVRMPQRDGRQITLVDLATHTAGFPLRPPNLSSRDPANPYARYTIAQMYQGLSMVKLEADPGSRYQYSNVGFGLLGHLLERRTGRSYAELVRSRITGPLGMADTAIGLSPQMRRHQPQGYDAQLEPAGHWSEGALLGAGALRSTANDLLRLLGAVLAYQPSELQPAMRAMLDTRRPGGMQPATQIALAWNIWEDHGRTVVWKNGSVGGFRSFVGYDPQARLGVVALANAQTGTGVDDIGLHLLNPSFPVNLQKPSEHKEVVLPGAVLDRYVGRYHFASDNSVLEISRKGEHLAGNMAGQAFEMYAESERGFFLKVVDAQAEFEGADGPAGAVIWHQAGQSDRGERIP